MSRSNRKKSLLHLNLNRPRPREKSEEGSDLNSGCRYNGRLISRSSDDSRRERRRPIRRARPSDRSGIVCLFPLLGLQKRNVIHDGKCRDYNTRFSGITSDTLSSALMDLPAVRSAACMFIGPETIIVGHGLENDLRALRLVHDKVIDTAIVSIYLNLPCISL